MKIFYLLEADGISNIDINALIKFHNSHNKMEPPSAVRLTSNLGH